MRKLFFTGTVLLSLLGQAQEQQHNVIMEKPASSWREALPMGNGRIGAMVEGGIAEEVIHINEDTLWSGEPQPHYNGKNCLGNLSAVRELLFKGEHAKATRLGNQKMLGRNNEAYMPFGQLKIKHLGIDQSKAVDYDRRLNLNRAVTTTIYQVGAVLYTRTVLVSHPDQMMIVRIKSSKKGALSNEITLDSLLEHKTLVNDQGLLVMTGRAPIHADPHYKGRRVDYDKSAKQLGMRLCAVAQVEVVDGTVSTVGNRVKITNATECVIRLAARTSFNGFDKSPSQQGKDAQQLAVNDLVKSAALDYSKLHSRHLADYQPIFSRVKIELGNGEKQQFPVAQRVGSNYKEGSDPDLDELYYQFGRYLLISSTRAGSQAANLQGIWSYKMNPSWSSNYTVNCNAQFNYIGSGASGLAELNEPFLRLIEEAAVDGAKVAKSWYGTNGWVIHHNIDLWRAAIPSNGNVLWATFPTGGTWCVVELYDNWKFNPKMDFLKRINKLQKGSVEFWLENLQKHPKTGKHVSCPDVYFENVGHKKSGESVVLCSGPVSSTILIRQIFRDYIESSKKLKLKNDKLVARVEDMLKKMPAIETNKNGELRQWHEDFDGSWGESDRTQLLAIVGAIYSNQIHPMKTPELAAALMKMLDNRKSGLDGQASWRAAFPANAYARLGRGDLCKQVISATYRKWINPNLTARFIQADWEIDGNLGLMGAMQECLLQSHDDEIALLPALPQEWSKEGSVKGLRTRGGDAVSFSWKDGRVFDYSIKGERNKKLKLRVNGKVESYIVK